MSSLASLLAEVHACERCKRHLPLGPRPVLRVRSSARILIASQAPGRKAHETGLTFNDVSGDRLREWLGLSREEFYDESRVAIVPMGFCYPGTGRSGDLPPRPECAPAWRAPLLAHLRNLRLILAIGQYAVRYHVPDANGPLTEIVASWRRYWPAAVPFPHPSPRNNLWLRRNPWFERDVLPAVRQRVRVLIG
jgi:uracil-DNA glycosylase